MVHLARNAVSLSQAQARKIWVRAQRLDEPAPFGEGPAATPAAVAHLGYVQIDTINVIERCHHHILFSRIPGYRREHLQQAQSRDKTVFEYWAHALAYIPIADMRFFTAAMKERWKGRHESTVTPYALAKVIGRIRRSGPLTLRDIDDDRLVEKDHAWASRKPSARALKLGFNGGVLTISARNGILKTYELSSRHFGWTRPPAPASRRDLLAYRLNRALRSQGIVSLDSICYMDAPLKADMRKLIERRVRRKELVALVLEGADKTEHWAQPAALESGGAEHGLVHILSPFDPLIIQRKRLKSFFGYDHVFEAYVPKEKRKYGYFALPVLVDGQIVAAIDMKADRGKGQLALQKWTWIDKASRHLKPRIESELHRFERFQLAK